MNKSRSRLTFFLHWIFSFSQIPEVSGLRASPQVDMQEPTGVFCSLTYSWSAVCDVPRICTPTPERLRMSLCETRPIIAEVHWDHMCDAYVNMREHTYTHTYVHTHTNTTLMPSPAMRQIFPPSPLWLLPWQQAPVFWNWKVESDRKCVRLRGGGGDNEGGVDQSRCGRSSRVCTGPPQGADCYINTTPYVNISWPPGSTQVKGSQTLAPVDSSLHLFNCHRDGCTREMLDLIAL